MKKTKKSERKKEKQGNFRRKKVFEINKEVLKEIKELSEKGTKRNFQRKRKVLEKGNPSIVREPSKKEK